LGHRGCTVWHRPGAEHPPLEGPRTHFGGEKHAFAVANAWNAPMVAFGLGSWRSRQQRVVWVPLVEV